MNNPFPASAPLLWVFLSALGVCAAAGILVYEIFSLLVRRARIRFLAWRVSRKSSFLTEKERQDIFHFIESGEADWVDMSQEFPGDGKPWLKILSREEREVRRRKRDLEAQSAQMM